MSGRHRSWVAIGDVSVTKVGGRWDVYVAEDWHLCRASEERTVLEVAARNVLFLPQDKDAVDAKVHELGSNEQGAVFYSMKKVQGTSWSEVIDTNSREENLDILLRVQS